jgi:ABC-type glycerol-3-phosphate transport system permease component
MSSITVTPRISRHRLKNFTIYGILITVTFVLMIPVIWLVLTSLKTESEYTTDTLQLLPSVVQWDNYRRALTMIDFGKYARNSVVLATLFASLTMASSSMAGFAFARLPAPGRGKLYAIVIGLILIPTSIYVIPQFILFTQIKGVVGSYWPWVLWGLAGSPLHIFLFRQFFASFPAELEEAAEVDGANTFRIFFQVLLPNAKPIMATSFILNFLFVWGDWFMPILYLRSDNTTLAHKLISGYLNPQGYPLNSVTMAASVIYILPPVIMFFLMQKYIMEGVVTSGLKG